MSDGKPPKMEQRNFSAGETIFMEGDAGESAFLVVSGVVEISRQTERGKTVLGEIQPGGLFGEMALINDKPRMATATTAKDTICFEIPIKAFHEGLNQADAFMKAMLLSLIQHVRRLSDLLEKANQFEDGDVQLFLADDTGEYKRVK